MTAGLERAAVAQRELKTYANMSEALAATGLDWEVKKRPLFARIPTGVNETTGESTGIMKRSDNLYAITRTDTNATLGVATARYHTASNAEVFAPLGEVASENGIRIATTHEIDGGKLVAVQALPEKKMTIAGEEVRPYMLFVARHDGKGGISGFSAPERLACLNQLRRLIFDEIVIGFRHTASVQQKLEDARKLVRAAFNQQEQFIRTAEELLASTWSRQEFEDLAFKLLPKPDASDPTITTRMVNNWDRRFTALMEQAYNAPDLNDIRYTPWGAVNAIADFEQHLLPIRGEGQELQENLFKRAMFNGDLTSQAMKILLPSAN